MSLNSWVSLLNNASADGTALTASTTETSILNALQKQYSLAAGDLDFVGKKFRLTAAGRISNIVTTPGTLTLKLKFGSIAVWNSGALPLNIVAKTNVGWWLDILMELRSIGNGTSATIFGMGPFTSESVIGSPAATAGGNGTLILPYNSAPAVGAGFDSTAAQAIDLTATWSLNNANSVQDHIWAFEKLN